MTDVHEPETRSYNMTISADQRFYSLKNEFNDLASRWKELEDSIEDLNWGEER